MYKFDRKVPENDDLDKHQGMADEDNNMIGQKD